MGYSHYFAYDPNAPEFTDGMAALAVDAQLIVATAAKAGVEVSGANEGPAIPPFLDPTGFFFNGVEPDAHETFHFSANPRPDDFARVGSGMKRNGPFVWRSCKTARKPYDLVVCAILLRARQLMPTSFAIGSDGDWNDEWMKARGLMAMLFGGDAVDVAGVDDPLGETCDGPPSCAKATLRAFEEAKTRSTNRPALTHRPARR